MYLHWVMIVYDFGGWGASRAFRMLSANVFPRWRYYYDFGRGGARRELSSNISSLGDDSMDMDEVQGECPEWRNMQGWIDFVCTDSLEWIYKDGWIYLFTQTRLNRSIIFHGRMRSFIYISWNIPKTNYFDHLNRVKDVGKKKCVGTKMLNWYCKQNL